MMIIYQINSCTYSKLIQLGLIYQKIYFNSCGLRAVVSVDMNWNLPQNATYVKTLNPLGVIDARP